jgi:serine/threonine-protein kinase
VIGDRYRLERRLGTGGWGEVWKAEHVDLRSPVALKVVTRAIAPREASARLLREARAAAAIRSPHVVQLLELGLHERRIPFLVMELLEGEDLAERLDRARGPLPWPDVARILTHVGRAITRAHEAGIVHRDLKPENIFLVEDDDGEVAKVLDFGIAKLSEHLANDISGHSRTGSLFGTPHYMSPEQLCGEEPVTHRADLYAMGILAFECVTGRLPLRGQPLGNVLRAVASGRLPRPSTVARVPLGFDEWFAQAAARRPEQRFESARALTRALGTVLTPQARPETDSDPPNPRSSSVRAIMRPEPADAAREPAVAESGAPRPSAWASSLLVRRR